MYAYHLQIRHGGSRLSKRVYTYLDYYAIIFSKLLVNLFLVYFAEWKYSSKRYMQSYCVIGSLNMDLVVTVERFPKPGETLTGGSFQAVPGGKGANQAVALSRLGVPVTMFGRVGNDAFGESCLAALKKEKVSTGGIYIDEESPTGTALIEVEASGENRIIVVPGANGRVGPGDIAARLPLLPAADIYLLQLEIPLESVFHVLRGRTAGKTYILDPAPAAALPRDIYSRIDYLTPNIRELEILRGGPIRNKEEAFTAAAALVRAGTPTVVVKAGEHGAYLVSANSQVHIPACPVVPVDTTGAGDTFNAAFAAALGKGLPPENSVRFANAAAALSTQKRGAQTGMPDEQSVWAFLGK
jgi:ribokinase